MIDTHCHILPDIDDGPRTKEGAMRMAMEAVNLGIHTIVATPHHGTKRFNNTAAQIERRVKQMNKALQSKRISLTILPGQEFRLNADFRHQIRKGHARTLANSHYLLTELPARNIPEYFQDFLNFMSRSSLGVIIAHPERNSAIIRNPEVLQNWISQGVILQVTTQALVGFFGEGPRQTASYICRQRWAQLIASDAHDSYQRTFYYREGLQKIEEICGVAYVEELQKNAEAVIRGRQIGAQGWI
ncbi:tyrosine-protein phosphatase [Paenibacillus sp. JCM 10914]|uniref:tyrosine-protein phosphatase n=1 Tax=Paenibacillus sp. JCM 10914 TaxID=1236974 RepID=UPI000562920C|nr:CpsB/CapC family capsule biosynthesis tyrosine phosphatase [Paenibacillus sp. JCM 10914]